MTLALRLQSALDQLAYIRPRALPEVPRCVAAMAEATRGLVDGGNAPAMEHLEALVASFRIAARNAGLDHFTKREWGDVVWGIWLEPDPLVEIEAFFSALVARLGEGSRRLCRRLILAYLAFFDAEQESCRRIGRVLRFAVSAWDWDWTGRDQQFSLFDPQLAPARLGRHCITSSEPIAACLAGAGISGTRRFSGLEKAAFSHALGDVRIALETDHPQATTALDRLLEWAIHDGRLAYPTLKAPLAEALLLPWQTRQPPDAMRERITEFLLRHVGDPRIHPLKWSGVKEEAQRVLRRWLTRVALEQFLQVVDGVAEPEHWKYRRPFWIAYYEKGLIEEAWVLFGPAAEPFGRIRELGGYGKLKHPRQNNHCALLMRLTGDLTVAEMSHNGKCRIWLPSRREAPVLYRPRYELRDIENDPNLEISHCGSRQLHWQVKIAEFLRNHAGFAFNKSHFIPR